MSLPRQPSILAQPALLSAAQEYFVKGQLQQAINIYAPFAQYGDVYSQTMLRQIATMQASMHRQSGSVLPAQSPVPPALLKSWQEDMQQVLNDLAEPLKEIAALFKQPSTTPMYRRSDDDLRKAYQDAIEKLKQGELNPLGNAYAYLQQELAVEHKGLQDKLQKKAGICFQKCKLAEKHDTLKELAKKRCEEMASQLPSLLPPSPVPASVSVKMAGAPSSPPSTSAALIKKIMTPEAHRLAEEEAGKKYGIKSEKTDAVIKTDEKSYPIGKDIIPSSYPHHQITQNLLKQHLPELLTVAEQLQKGGWKVYLVGSTVDRLLKAARNNTKTAVKFSDIDLVICPGRADPELVPLKTLFPSGQEISTRAKVFEYRVGDKKFDISRMQKYVSSAEMEEEKNAGVAPSSLETNQVEVDFARRDTTYPPYLELESLNLIAHYVDKLKDEPLEDVLLRANRACGLVPQLWLVNDSNERLEADPRIIERILWKLMTADYTLRGSSKRYLLDNACWLAKLGLRYSLEKSSRYWRYLLSPETTLTDLERMNRVWGEYEDVFSFLFSAETSGSLNHAETFAEALQKTLVAARSRPVDAPDATQKELPPSPSPAAAKDPLLKMDETTEQNSLNKAYNDSKNILREMAKLYKEEKQTFDGNYECIDYAYYTAVKCFKNLSFKEDKDKTIKEKKAAKAGAGIETKVVWRKLGDAFNQLQLEIAKSDLQLKKSDNQMHKAFRRNLSNIAQRCYRSAEAIEYYPQLAGEKLTLKSELDVHLVPQINSIKDIEMVLNHLEKSLAIISLLKSDIRGQTNRKDRIPLYYCNIINQLQFGNWIEVGSHCRHLQMQIESNRNTLLAKNTLSRIQSWADPIAAAMENNPALAKAAKELINSKKHSDIIAKLAAATPCKKPDPQVAAATASSTSQQFHRTPSPYVASDNNRRRRDLTTSWRRPR